MAGPFIPGRGVDMTDPANPRISLLVAFNHKQQATPARAVTLHDARTDFFDSTSLSVHDEAELLSLNFRTAFGGLSAGATFNQVVQQRTSSQTLYIIITSLGDSEIIAPSEITWSAAPAAEKMAESQAAYQQFIGDYGSHFIFSVDYGVRIAIRAKVNSTDSSRFSSISASVKASFSAFANGDVNAMKSIRDTLSAVDVEIHAAVSSGRIVPESYMIMDDFSQVSEFLTKLRNGAGVTVQSGPVQCIVRSYWSTLAAFPKSRAFFAEVPAPSPIGAPFGVPSGTIVAWSPPAASTFKDASGVVHVLPPAGWVVCNGTDPNDPGHLAPDLSDRFIMGVRDVSDRGQTGGNATHTHTGHTSAVSNAVQANFPVVRGNGGDSLPGVDHFHGIVLDPQVGNSLPPYFKLIYIMKQ
jgi:hypothetical protein